MRPIALLNTFRKSMVKVIQKRLNKIFTKRHILKGFNFADLLDNSTRALIHIVNNLIEVCERRKGRDVNSTTGH